MKITRCDNHPDREAVATFHIIKYPTIGARPFITGYSVGGETVDLCDECVKQLPFKKKDC